MMKFTIKGVSKGDFITKRLAGSAFAAAEAPEDGVVLTPPMGAGVYLRRKDLSAALEMCGQNDAAYEADAWSKDAETQAEQVPPDGGRDSE